MTTSITSANAVVMIGVGGLFPVPQQLQGFAADDIYGVDAIESAEMMMGVDGKLSAGFVFVPIPQNFSLQADSRSNTLFEAWYQAQQTAKELFYASGIVTLRSVGRSYVMNGGILSSYKPMSDAKKVLQPRSFRITWETVIPVPVG